MKCYICHKDIPVSYGARKLVTEYYSKRKHYIHTACLPVWWEKERARIERHQTAVSEGVYKNPFNNV